MTKSKEKTVTKNREIVYNISENVIQGSYLSSEKDIEKTALCEGLKRVFNRHGLDDKILLVCNQYRLIPTIRYKFEDYLGVAIPYINDQNKILEILEIVTLVDGFPYPIVDGIPVSVACDVWKSKIEYRKKTKGDKANLCGVEITNRAGYELNNDWILIGEHLLNESFDKPVAITKDFVEAIVLNIMDDSHIYLSRGSNYCYCPPCLLLTDRTRKVLEGKKVEVLPSEVDDSCLLTYLYKGVEQKMPFSEILENVYKHTMKIQY